MLSLKLTALKCLDYTAKEQASNTFRRNVMHQAEGRQEASRDQMASQEKKAEEGVSAKKEGLAG